MESRFRTVDREARRKEMGERGAREGDELQEVRKSQKVLGVAVMAECAPISFRNN